jgi:hypothetical protein
MMRRELSEMRTEEKDKNGTEGKEEKSREEK